MANIINKITVSELYRKHGDLLKLEWIAGKRGANRIVVPELVNQHAGSSNSDDLDTTPASGSGRSPYQAGKSMVGYLNLIHPHQIQLLGKVELDFLVNLRDTTVADTLDQIFSSELACMIVTDGCAVPEVLVQKCNAANVPLLCTPSVSATVSDTLHYFLMNLFADVITMHGVFMEVMAIGVLISGPSGIGKSELALELITRGHRLVADDAPLFSKIAPDIIRGSCHESLQDFIEVRGLGIINVRRLYGESAIKKDKYLRLITRLEPMEKEVLVSLDRLEGSYRNIKVFDLDIPEITLPVAPGRNMAILVETAVRNHVLRTGGYNSSLDFVNLQRQLVEQNSGK